MAKNYKPYIVGFIIVISAISLLLNPSPQEAFGFIDDIASAMASS